MGSPIYSLVERNKRTKLGKKSRKYFQKGVRGYKLRNLEEKIFLNKDMNIDEESTLKEVDIDSKKEDKKTKRLPKQVEVTISQLDMDIEARVQHNN